jgi:hypothetical protein
MSAVAPEIVHLPLNEAFSVPADEAAIERAATALRSHGIDVQVVNDGATARDLVLSLVPEGSEVNSGASATLATIGVTEVLEQSGKYNALRPITRAMDRATEAEAIRKLGAAPNFFVNSVNAVTEDGKLVMASFGGSQLGPLVAGAGRVILVVGAQKVVPDLATAFRRIEEYAYPLEDVRLQMAFNGYRSAINKLVVINGDFPGRITVILVREALGF